MAAAVLLFPLTMLSNTFVSPEPMPGWLGTVAEWNPMSSTVRPTRELFGNAGLSPRDSWVGRARVADGRRCGRC